MQATDTARADTALADSANAAPAATTPTAGHEDAADSDVVSRYRPIDPGREIMLRGFQLQDGMRVLIADPDRRARDTSPSSSNPAVLAEYEHERRTRNRWCVVRQPVGEARVSFVGEYDDGDLQVRDYSGVTLWIVQRDTIATSLPKPPAPVGTTAWTPVSDVRRLPALVSRYRVLVAALAAVLLVIGVLWIATGVLPGDRGSVPDGAVLIVTGAATLLARRFLDPR